MTHDDHPIANAAALQLLAVAYADMPREPDTTSDPPLDLTSRLHGALYAVSRVAIRELEAIAPELPPEDLLHHFSRGVGSSIGALMQHMSEGERITFLSLVTMNAMSFANFLDDHPERVHA
jgi:hypothetical protein